MNKSRWGSFLLPEGILLIVRSWNGLFTIGIGSSSQPVSSSPLSSGDAAAKKSSDDDVGESPCSCKHLILKWWVTGIQAFAKLISKKATSGSNGATRIVPLPTMLDKFAVVVSTRYNTLPFATGTKIPHFFLFIYIFGADHCVYITITRRYFQF